MEYSLVCFRLKFKVCERCVFVYGYVVCNRIVKLFKKKIYLKYFIWFIEYYFIIIKLELVIVNF